MLKDKSASRAVQRERAAALQIMGDVFHGVGQQGLAREAEGGAPSEQRQREVAQQRVERAMHDLLEKMDREEREAAGAAAAAAER